jgi:hypothetical protein
MGMGSSGQTFEAKILWRREGERDASAEAFHRRGWTRKRFGQMLEGRRQFVRV